MRDFRLHGAAVITAVALFAVLPLCGFDEVRDRIVKVLPDLQRAYRADPTKYASAWNLALAYFRLDRLAEAQDVAKRILQQKTTAEVHNLLGEIAEKAGDQQQAAAQYEAAARLEPSEKNLGDFAGFLLRRAALDAAIRTYEFGIRLHPTSQPLYLGLGLAYHGRGDYDNAMKWICAAVDLAPRDPRAIEFLGKLVNTSEKFAPEASRRLEHFARLYPNRFEARYYFAMSLLRATTLTSRDAAVIEENLRAAADLDPSSYDAHLQLGIFCERRGRDEDAVQALLKAVQLRPDSETAHYRLARLYQRSGKTELAGREFEAVKRLRSADRSTSAPSQVP